MVGCINTDVILKDSPVKGIFGDPQEWDPFMVSFPYYSHIFRDSYGSGMGIVWEAYHKGVPLLGVPENATDPAKETWILLKTWHA